MNTPAVCVVTKHPPYSVGPYMRSLSGLWLDSLHHPVSIMGLLFTLFWSAIRHKVVPISADVDNDVDTRLTLSYLQLPIPLATVCCLDVRNHNMERLVDSRL